jgi:hypothetical protein
MFASAILKPDSIAHGPSQLIGIRQFLPFLLHSGGDFFAHAFGNTHCGNSPRLGTPYNEVTTAVSLFHQILDQLCGLNQYEKLQE